MRKSLAYLVLAGALFFTGCSNSVELTGNESDVLSDYMTSVVLKHAENYENNLYTVNEINEIEAAVFARNEKFNKAKENSDFLQVSDGKEEVALDKDKVNDIVKDKESAINTSEVKNQANITSIIGNKNFNIEYKEYKLMNSYVEDITGIQVDAREEKQLVVIEFNIKNQGKTTSKLDLVEEDIKYQLQGKGITEKPILTLLMNDLQYYNMDIEPGKVQQAVILFEVDKKLDVKEVELIVTRDNTTSNINLK